VLRPLPAAKTFWNCNLYATPGCQDEPLGLGLNPWVAIWDSLQIWDAVLK